MSVAGTNFTDALLIIHKVLRYWKSQNNDVPDDFNSFRTALVPHAQNNNFILPQQANYRQRPGPGGKLFTLYCHFVPEYRSDIPDVRAL